MKNIFAVLLSLIASPNVWSQTKQHQFSAEELKILEEGIISDDRRNFGGLLGTIVGFGTGHMVTGQWDETGWIFTGAEALSVAVMGYGLSHLMTNEGTLQTTLGLVGFVGLRAFEIYDVWTRPNLHNAKVRSLQEQKSPKLSFGILPADEGPQATLIVKF